MSPSEGRSGSRPSTIAPPCALPAAVQVQACSNLHVLQNAGWDFDTPRRNEAQNCVLGMHTSFFCDSIADPSPNCGPSGGAYCTRPTRSHGPRRVQNSPVWVGGKIKRVHGEQLTPAVRRHMILLTFMHVLHNTSARACRLAAYTRAFTKTAHSASRNLRRHSSNLGVARQQTLTHGGKHNFSWVNETQLAFSNT